MTLLDADKKDRIFALLYFILGYGFIYVFVADHFKYIGIYTVFYAALMLGYLYAKGKKPTKESWFWLVIMLMIGIPFPFWSALGSVQPIALVFTAAYWSMAASSRLIEKSTSNWVFFDWFNSLTIVPCSNFTCQFRVLKEGEGQKNKLRRYVGSVLLGVAIAIPVLFIILPLLFKADAGFERVMNDLMRWLISERILIILFRILISIPVSCYLYGLVYGTVSGRITDRIDKDVTRRTGEQIRKMPDVTTVTVMALVCAVYFIFIAVQGNYLFSAFFGKMPEWFTYAEYARRGFFELCGIGAWNLGILLLASLISRTPGYKNTGLKIMTVILSVLTLLLIATAVSKMGMYISAYGLTVKRVLTMTFMLWMAIVFTSVIVKQKKKIPMVKICVMTGAVMFSLLCVLPVEKWIEVYNNIYMV